MALPRNEAPLSAAPGHETGARDPFHPAPEGGEPGARRRGSRATEAVLRAAWAHVDLDALSANYRHLAGRVGEAGIVAVVKADAYGHGAVRVTRRLEELGARLAAVALLEEAAELRRAGVALPILALGPASPAQMPLYRRYRVIPTVSGLDQLEAWRRWAAGLPRGERQPLHLKVDTGMGRLGVSPREVDRALEVLRGEPRLEMVGLLSHFAEAEDLDSEASSGQQRLFGEVLERLTGAERERVRVHLANSAAALHRPGSRHDLVRLGLALYGLDPAETLDASGEPGWEPGEEGGLRPVMSVSGRIVSLRTVPAGSRVSYGGRWTAPRESRVAVLPLGYADGYPWSLSGRAEVLVAGRRAPVVGAVTMDMTLIDVTEVPGAEVGTEVILLGGAGPGAISARRLAAWAGTIPYEILCRLGQRLPRRYLEGGRLAGVASALIRDGGSGRGGEVG